jgi:hypothetical protein
MWRPRPLCEAPSPASSPSSASLAAAGVDVVVAADDTAASHPRQQRVRLHLQSAFRGALYFPWASVRQEPVAARIASASKPRTPVPVQTKIRAWWHWLPSVPSRQSSSFVSARRRPSVPGAVSLSACPQCGSLSEDWRMHVQEIVPPAALPG